jgi:hypothetical protein
MESIGKILRLSFSHSLQRLLLIPALFRQPEQTFDLLLLFDILLFVLATREGVEPSTYGFGIHCSASCRYRVIVLAPRPGIEPGTT